MNTHGSKFRARGATFAARGASFAQHGSLFVPRGTEPATDVLPGFDGTSTIRYPTLATHWRALTLPIPGHDWLMQDDGITNGGGLLDVVRGAILAKVGTGHVYQVATADPAGYATFSIKLVDGTASMGFNLGAGSLWDINFGWVKVYFTLEAVVPATTRTLIAMTGAAQAALQIVTSTGAKLRLLSVGGTSVNGTARYDATPTLRYPGILTWRSSFLGGSGIVRVSTPKETFSATWAGQADSTKGIGPAGSASLTASASGLSRLAVFQGAAAEYIENMGGGGAAGDKAFLQALGWTGFAW